MEQNFIPGIYNYCDRWCERCAFTNRCRSYAREEEENKNEKNWTEQVSSNLQQAIEMLEEFAQEMDVDPDEADRLRCGYESDA